MKIRGDGIGRRRRILPLCLCNPLELKARRRRRSQGGEEEESGGGGGGKGGGVRRRRRKKKRKRKKKKKWRISTSFSPLRNFLYSFLEWLLSIFLLSSSPITNTSK